MCLHKVNQKLHIVLAGPVTYQVSTAVLRKRDMTFFNPQTFNSSTRKGKSKVRGLNVQFKS